GDFGSFTCRYVGWVMAGDLQALADSLGRRLERAVAIDDPHMRLLAYNSHYGHVDPVRTASILHRKAPAAAIAWVNKLRIRPPTPPPHPCHPFPRDGRPHLRTDPLPGTSARLCLAGRHRLASHRRGPGGGRRRGTSRGRDPPSRAPARRAGAWSRAGALAGS